MFRDRDHSKRMLDSWLSLCTCILESESATAAALSKWFGQQQSPNSTDGVKSLEQMMSVKELEQKQAD